MAIVKTETQTDTETETYTETEADTEKIQREACKYFAIIIAIWVSHAGTETEILISLGLRASADPHEIGNGKCLSADNNNDDLNGT